MSKRMSNERLVFVNTIKYPSILATELLDAMSAERAQVRELEQQNAELRAALVGLLQFHEEDEGGNLPREYWSPKYLAAVEKAEALNDKGEAG